VKLESLQTASIAEDLNSKEMMTGCRQRRLCLNKCFSCNDELHGI